MTQHLQCLIFIYYETSQSNQLYKALHKESTRPVLCRFCLSLQATPARAQDTMKDANSVVTDARTEILCKSMTQSVEKESRTITILNRKGLEDAAFYCGCDMFRSPAEILRRNHQRFGTDRAQDKEIRPSKERIQFLTHHGRLFLLLRVQLPFPSPSR